MLIVDLGNYLVESYHVESDDVSSILYTYVGLLFPLMCHRSLYFYPLILLPLPVGVGPDMCAI